MGSFCHNCNCINCSNTLEHEDERNKAVKLVLERNPTAFQSKIGKFSKKFKNIFLCLFFIVFLSFNEKHSPRHRNHRILTNNQRIVSTIYRVVI